MKSSSRLRSVTSAACLLALAGMARAADAPPAAMSPSYGGSGASPYAPIRWMEDYSYLKNPALRTDWADPVKYIPFTSDGDWYVSFGGQARERYEYFNDNLFGVGPQDNNGFYLTRLTASADVHLGQWGRVFLEGKSSLIDGRVGGPRPIDADEIDLQQAFVESNIPLGDNLSATVRLGRQEMLFGAQRLIGVSDWSNNRRTFEGLRSTFKLPQNNTLDVFLVRPVVVDKEQLNDGDGNTAFWGIYNTMVLGDVITNAKSSLDLYVLGLHKTQTGAFSTAPAVAVDSDTYTLGTRFVAKGKPWDFEIEADYQFGQSGAGSIRAYSFSTEVGYSFADAKFSPRAFLGFDIASGDRDPNDSDKETFNQLFPTGHSFFGYIDAVGRQNIIDLHPGVTATLLKNRPYCANLSVRAEYHWFWRQSTEDALYSATGGVTRASGGSSNMYVGSEFDLVLNWQINSHFSAQAGYCHFFASDFISATGPSEDIDFLYVAMQFTF